MKDKAVFVLIGIGVAAGLFGGGFLTGKKTCPQVAKPIPTAQIPEVKKAETKAPVPPKPVIRWETETIMDTAALEQAERMAYAKGYKKGWDSSSSAHHAFWEPERFVVTDTIPHTKDSITYFPLADTFSVVHMEIFPTVLAEGKQETGGKHRSLLHLGVNFWFGEKAEVWGTIPVPKDRRAFYFPDRIGPNYRIKDKAFKLTLEWEVL